MGLALGFKSLYFASVLLVAGFLLPDHDLGILSVYVAYLPVQACLDLGSRLYLYRRIPLVSADSRQSLIKDAVLWGCFAGMASSLPIGYFVLGALPPMGDVQMFLTVLSVLVIISGEAGIQFWITAWCANGGVGEARGTEAVYWGVKILLTTAVLLFVGTFQAVLMVDLYIALISCVCIAKLARKKLEAGYLEGNAAAIERRFQGFSVALRFGLGAWATFFVSATASIMSVYITTPTLASQFILADRVFAGIRLLAQAPVTAVIPMAAKERAADRNRTWNLFLRRANLSILLYLAASALAIISLTLLRHISLPAYQFELPLIVVCGLAFRWATELYHSNLAQFALTSADPHFFWSGLFSGMLVLTIVPIFGDQAGLLGLVLGTIFSQMIVSNWLPAFVVASQDCVSFADVLFHRTRSTHDFH